MGRRRRMRRISTGLATPVVLGLGIGIGCSAFDAEPPPPTHEAGADAVTAVDSTSAIVVDGGIRTADNESGPAFDAASDTSTMPECGKVPSTAPDTVQCFDAYKGVTLCARPGACCDNGSGDQVCAGDVSLCGQAVWHCDKASSCSGALCCAQILTRENELPAQACAEASGPTSTCKAQCNGSEVELCDPGAPQPCSGSKRCVPILVRIGPRNNGYDPVRVGACIL